jgi:protein-disulfide isomerase/uncharacterized membrane protein
MHPFAFVLGIVAILVGIYAAGVLSLSHFEIMKPPGCGPGSGCAGAAASVFGSVPIPGTTEKWPTSHLGLAYFVAVGVVWMLSRRGMSTGLRLMIIAGTIGSLFYTTQIVLHIKEYFCAYCLACHGANFVLFALTFVGGGQGRGTGRALATGAMAFAVATAGLIGLGAWSDKAAREKGEQELGESIGNLVEKNEADAARATATPSPAVPPTPAPTTTPGTTTAPAQTPGDIARGAPELRDRPLAITVQGHTAGKGFTGHYRVGYEDAPIRVVMFSDYQCADCQRIERELFRLLEGRNDIMFSHRHFPFCRPCNEAIPSDMHPNACWAAIAAEVAGEMYGPEAFWKMHKWLFDRRGSFTNEELIAGLKALGFDAQVFQARMNQQMQGGALLKRIQADVREAQDLGLHYTPLMFVNGVEIRAFRTPGALTRAVLALAERNPPLGSPEFDTPPTAAEKYVDDWATNPAMGPLGRDRFLAMIGDPEAPVRVEAWLDYSGEDSRLMDGQIRKILQERQDVVYVVRHFPFSSVCVPQIKANDRPHACDMAKAAEAAGQIAGVEAYFKVHDWLMANQNGFSIDDFREFLGTSGLDAEAIIARMTSPEVSGAIQDDTGEFYAKKMSTLPHVWVDYKDVPRWKLEGDDVIRAIVERAADGK